MSVMREHLKVYWRNYNDKRDVRKIHASDLFNIKLKQVTGF